MLAAEQARETAALVAERRAEIEAEIASVSRPGIGTNRRREHAERQVVAELARARRISPWQARQYLRWAVEAQADTPETFGRLARGEVSERRAQIVFEQVRPLAADDRRLVDTGIAANLDGWGDRKVERRTRTAVQELDPAGACERAARAANERRVTTRPAPDSMGWLTLLAPMPEIVACRAALERSAKDAHAAGDPRTRDHVMADTLVERATGQQHVPDVPLAIQLLVSDLTLLGASDTPARLADGTPIPAPLARAMVLDTEVAHRVRRLFCDPVGRLVTSETASRDFTRAMAEFIALRDGGTCTTDWCDAPIRHTDHHLPHTHGGPTSLANGRGRCQWCNETKSDRIPDPEPPPDRQPNRPPGRPTRGRRPRRSRVERLARRRIATAMRP